MVQCTQQQFQFGCEAQGLHLIWLGVEQGASKGSLQSGKGVVGPCCPQAALLSPLPALGPHICLFFNFLLGKNCCGLAGLSHRLPAQQGQQPIPCEPLHRSLRAGQLPGGLRTLKSLPNLLSGGKQCFTHPDPSLLSPWSVDGKLRGP